ncbi:hypothetical protein JOL62DRAFT_223411 [Phyllosticta paracitricarpa]|uniref:Uncharacterized protein n=1 Tax=Phyllosticta paracitricarpa TaxID=2016321 RepID=A0ABR1MZS4_9PEZI
MTLRVSICGGKSKLVELIALLPGQPAHAFLGYGGTVHVSACRLSYLRTEVTGARRGTPFEKTLWLSPDSDSCGWRTPVEDAEGGGSSPRPPLPSAARSIETRLVSPNEVISPFAFILKLFPASSYSLILLGTSSLAVSLKFRPFPPVGHLIALGSGPP